MKKIITLVLAVLMVVGCCSALASCSGKNDTIKIEKWHTKYIEKLRVDTTYIAKTDTVPVPYEVKVEVPAKISKTQKGLMMIGLLSIMAAIVALAFWLKKLFRL